MRSNFLSVDHAQCLDSLFGKYFLNMSFITKLQGKGNPSKGFTYARAWKCLSVYLCTYKCKLLDILEECLSIPSRKCQDLALNFENLFLVEKNQNTFKTCQGTTHEDSHCPHQLIQQITRSDRGGAATPGDRRVMKKLISTLAKCNKKQPLCQIIWNCGNRIVPATVI